MLVIGDNVGSCQVVFGAFRKHTICPARPRAGELRSIVGRRWSGCIARATTGSRRGISTRTSCVNEKSHRCCQRGLRGPGPAEAPPALPHQCNLGGADINRQVLDSRIRRAGVGEIGVVGNLNRFHDENAAR